MKTFRLVIPLFFALTMVSQTASSQVSIANWNLSELQPDISYGGRASTIAVNPKSDNNIFVASESGGLFVSHDRGNTWKHIDTLPLYSTNAVAFVPASPDTLVITAGEDFKTSNSGGIWRSSDGGTSWTQVLSRPLGAWEISIDPDTGRIYVATANGVSISTDNAQRGRLKMCSNMELVPCTRCSPELII